MRECVWKVWHVENPHTEFVVLENKWIINTNTFEERQIGFRKIAIVIKTKVILELIKYFCGGQNFILIK